MPLCATSRQVFSARAQFVQQRVEARRQLQHRLAAANRPAKQATGGLEVRAVAGRALEPAEVLFAQALLHLAAGQPVAAAMWRAVSSARESGEDKIRSTGRSCAASMRPSASAWAWPRGVRAMSVAPQILFSHIPERFAVRVKYSVSAMGLPSPFMFRCRGGGRCGGAGFRP